MITDVSRGAALARAYIYADADGYLVLPSDLGGAEVAEARRVALDYASRCENEPWTFDEGRLWRCDVILRTVRRFEQRREQ
jgi:hypothetical protein